MPKPLTLGRAALDERGVRQGPFLGFIGKRFDLAWSTITGWAVGADVMRSHADPEGRVLAWVLELDHAGGTEVIRWARGEQAFHAFANVVAEQLPVLGREPRVGKRYDARLPDTLARIAGLKRD